MKKAILTSVLLACPWVALSDEVADAFDQLETQIEVQLKKGDLHPASVAAIRAQWADFKKAHDRPIDQGEFRGATFACGLSRPPVDVKSIAEYSGAYVFQSLEGRPDAPGPHLKIEVSKENRVFVLRESRRIPAVVNNKIIFFTDGEFLREKAQFGTQVFASLKFKMLYRAKGAGMVIGSTDAHFDDLSRLLRFEGADGKAEQSLAEEPVAAGESR